MGGGWVVLGADWPRVSEHKGWEVLEVGVGSPHSAASQQTKGHLIWPTHLCVAGDRLARFGGAPAAELHKAVAAAVETGRFSKPPIQIGSQLSLADERWAAVAVWAAWKSLLGARGSVLGAVCWRGSARACCKPWLALLCRLCLSV